MTDSIMRMLSSRRRSPSMSVSVRHRRLTTSRDGMTVLPLLMTFPTKEVGLMPIPHPCSKYLCPRLRYSLPLLWCLLQDQMSLLRTDRLLSRFHPPHKKTSCSQQQQSPLSMACSTSPRALGLQCTTALSPWRHFNVAFAWMVFLAFAARWLYNLPRRLPSKRSLWSHQLLLWCKSRCLPRHR